MGEDVPAGLARKMIVVAPNFDTRSDPEEDHNVLPSYLFTKSIDCTAVRQFMLEI